MESNILSSAVMIHFTHGVRDSWIARLPILETTVHETLTVNRLIIFLLSNTRLAEELDAAQLDVAEDQRLVIPDDIRALNTHVQMEGGQRVKAVILDVTAEIDLGNHKTIWTNSFPVVLPNEQPGAVNREAAIIQVRLNAKKARGIMRQQTSTQLPQST